VFDQYVQEEIIGIKFAQDLTSALPSELALLTDLDLEVLFNLKYLESNVMSFNMYGQRTDRMITEPKQQKRKYGQKGPMILCLDTSGSMHGQPELISKAMSLYLGIQALQTKRAMYIINFSTQLSYLNLQKEHALDDLIDFLGQSFHGGTDIIPALEHAVEILEQSSFHHADIVVISDFVMGNVSPDLMEKIEQYKQQGNGFYAVAVGNSKLSHLDPLLFDQIWMYQTSDRKIIHLNEMG